MSITNGRVQESNFHELQPLQIDEKPVVEVHFIESYDAPSGVGEMGVPPVAPAFGNAIFDATGIRLRSLPFKAEDLRGR